MKAPKAPDPVATAGAQAGMNKDTAITQFLLNATNQVTPYGSLNYTQNGSTFVPSETGQNWWQGPNGQYQQNAPEGAPTTTAATTKRVAVQDPRTGTTRYENQTTPGTTTPGTVPAGWKQVKGSYTPRFTATQTLSPDQQHLLDLQEAFGIKLGDLANTQATRLSGLLSKPFDGSNAATESRLMELGRKRLDPLLAQRRESTEQDAFNRGVRPGSEAYDNTMRATTEGENDAYNQLLLTGHNQAYQEGLTNRNQPINEILALASGAPGVQQPNFVNTPGAQVAPVDYTGLVNQQYQQKLQSYQSGMSGMFGLGSALLGAIPFGSDRRLKRDIERIGTLANGLPWYRFRYRWSPVWLEGLMSDDVRKVRPSAVIVDANGYDAVYYGEAMA